jgi:adenylate kinase family enzyme
MAAGELIKDEVTNSLFEAYVHAVLHDKKYMLLDGYPRTLEQMKTTMHLLTQHNREVLGIQFIISDEIALERMRGR